MSDELQHGSGLIFVVDDESLIQQTTKMILEECGYDVLIAGTGAEAVALFVENHNKIICTILDISLPDMSGMEVYKKFKNIDPNLRVIVSSGRTKDHTVEELLDCGADMFIAKPFSVLDLANCVAKIMGKD